MIKGFLTLFFNLFFVVLAFTKDCVCNELKEKGFATDTGFSSTNKIICKAKEYEQTASLFLSKKELDSTELYLELAETIYKNNGCSNEQIINIYKLKGTLYFLKTEYQLALEHTFKLLSFSQKTNNHEQHADALLSISNIFGRMGQPEKGLEYCDLSIPIIELIKPSIEKVDLLNKLGSRFYYFFQDTKKQSLFDRASLVYTEAILIAKKINYRKGIQVSYNKMSTLAYRKNDYKLALKYLDSSIAIHVYGSNNSILATSYGDKGNIFLKMGLYVEAKKWADSSLHYNLKDKFPPLIANSYSLLSEIADSLRDYKTAYRALYKEKKITDSISSDDKVKAVTVIEKKYNQSINEKTIKELSQQKLIYALLGLGGLLLASLIAFYFRQQSLKNKQKIVEIEQRLNRARMNPHFFFNALTAMQSIALKENNGKTLALNLSKFSNIMRETLESSYKEYVTVKQEISFLKEYMEIQKIRFPLLFSYALMVDGEMEPSDIMIPSMIIQPFIENSIEHGFADIEYHGQIRVDFRKINKSLEIEISDNGKGLSLPKSNLNEHISRARQIIKDRIYLLNIKLKTKADFSINNNKNDKGVIVKISLPIIYINANTNN